MKAATAFATMAVLWLCPAQVAEAQAQTQERARTLSPSTATLRGTVRDGYGSPISAAEVLVDGGTRRVRSDDDGNFVLRDLPVGLVSLTARRLGYEVASRQVRVATEGGTADWILVPAATQMRPVSVTARRQVSDQRLEGFRARLDKKPSGYLLSRDQIEQSAGRSFTDLLRRVPGVRVQPEGRGGTAVLLRSNGCSPIVFVDGYASSIGSFDFASIDLHMVEGVEVYPSASAMPAEFFSARGVERCGAVAIWSRPAQPRIPVRSATALRTHEEITAVLERATAFMSDDVEQTARILDGGPDVGYPDAMWRSGVSGEATLEFVVDTMGRINWQTLSVVSATHYAFATAVKEALVESRWEAAVRGGTRVAQIVQLPVYFSRVAEPRAEVPAGKFARYRP